MIKISIPWNMGLNQAQSFKKKFVQVKVKSLEVASLWKLGQQMDRVFIDSLITANTWLS